MYDPPAFLLDRPLAEMIGYWCDVSCSCGHSSLLPFLMLSTQYPGRTFGPILRALRCKGCDTPPKHVTLKANPTDGAVGIVGPRTWRIELHAPENGTF